MSSVLSSTAAPAETYRSDPAFLVNFERKINEKFDHLTNVLALRFIFYPATDPSSRVQPTRSVDKFPGTFRYDVYVKSHTKRANVREAQARKEELAFWISEGLDLGVVPTTYTAVNHPDLVNRIKSINSIAGWTLGTFSVIQQGVTTNKTTPKIDPNQATKVVLFNLIIGRYDAGFRNSVIDREGRIHEIDNEHFGEKRSDSWTLRQSDQLLDEQVIAHFLEFDPKNLTEILDKWESISPFEQIWHIGAEGPVQDDTKANIIENFSKIRSYLESNREKKITVGDLVSEVCKS